MQRAKFFLLIVGCYFMATNCASTRIASQGDPSFANKSYSMVLLYVDLFDLDLRKEAELSLQGKLSQYGIKCLPAHQIFFPGRVYSDFETANIIESNQIDATLIINISDAGATSTYIPPTTQTQTNAWISGNYLSGSSTTRTYGGYNIAKPWASFTAQLIDVNARTVVWIASAQTSGNAFADAKTLLRSMATETAKRLVKDKKVSQFVDQEIDEIIIKELSQPNNETKLPNFRAAVPESNKYSDEEILTAYRKKYPPLKKKDDIELIRLIEAKYSRNKE